MKQITLLVFAFLSITVFSQQIEVSGTISDTNGNVIPAANILVKGTTKGVQSDFDGNYKISIEKGKKLEFSYVGMKTLTKTVESNKMDIILQDDLLGLDEIIITGTSGLSKRKQLGSSISSVSAKDLSQAKANVSIGEALQGQIAGAKINRNSGDPSGGMSITLRGASSITGSTDPLIIIDGVIVNNTSAGLVDLGGNTQNRLVDINPDDIERVEVLKGAAASAIYGSLASNGVVQFFTKRGKSGKPRITYRTSVNTNSIRETLPYNTAQLKWVADDPTAVPVTYHTEEATRYNYQDYIFTNSNGYENALSISGGSEKTKYLVSLSQFKNEGIVRNTDFSRKSIRVRLDQELYKWLNLSVGSYFSNNKSNDIPNGTGYGPITSLLFADNLNNTNPDEYGNYPNIGWMANPNEAIDKIKASQEYYRTISDIKLKMNLLKGLNLNYTFGIDNSNGEGLLFIPRRFNTKPDGISEKNTSKSVQYNSDINASYNLNITDKIKSTTGVGYSYLNVKDNYFSMKNKQVGPIDTVIVTNPDVVTGGGDYRSQYAVWGGFLQETFDFNNQFFLTLAGRIDASSLFGKDKQQFYPKVSASYNISDATFWNDNLSNYVDVLKLRAAWGQTGSLTSIKPYSLASNYNNTAYNGDIGFYPVSLKGNPDIVPERQTEMEFGFDMSFLKSRASLEFTYYSQNVEDLLLERALSTTTGFSSRYENIGTMTNKGIEITLKATPVKGEFQWDFSSTFSKNKNNVTHVVGGKIDAAPGSAGFWGSSVVITGQPLGVFYGTFIARDSNGNPILDSQGRYQAALGHYETITLSDGESYQNAVQDFDSSGQPTGTKLKKVIGDPNPDFVASFTNSFKYKNFGFRFQIDMSQGNDVLSWDKRMGYRFQGGEFKGEELSDPNTPKDFYKPNFGIYETFLEDGSFVKLREAAISYNLKLKKSYMDNILFTFSGNNLISWDNHWGFDPEINTGGQTNGVLGQQMASIPIPRTFKLGAIFNF